MLKPEDYVDALRVEYEKTGNLRHLQDRFVALGIDQWSFGTWGRILSERQQPSYEQLCAIARLTCLPLPEAPPEVLSRLVKDWYVLCDGEPRFGVLMSEGGQVSFVPNATAEALKVIMRKSTKRPARKPSGVRVMMKPNVAKQLATLAIRAASTVQMDEQALQELTEAATRLYTTANRKLEGK